MFKILRQYISASRNSSALHVPAGSQHIYERSYINVGKNLEGETIM